MGSGRRIAAITAFVALAVGVAGHHLIQRAQAQGTVLEIKPNAPKQRDLRLFKVAPADRRILGPASHVDGFLGLNLVSVAMDQPEYWPNEKVRVKVMVPVRPKLKVTVTWQKRDATPHKVGPLNLDEGGVAVVEILNGEKERLQLGEYRVEVQGPDGGVLEATTFNVVEGNLGALSFAHEFKQVTKPADLDSAKGAWFLGNASGAGRRWGNGLSFKNELRVDNKPYSGPLELASRCMLPGCNGVDAGPRKKLDIKDGQLAATLDVGGHSGPFQIEVITKRGSLRHQFEGSSHVERDMVVVSMGLGWDHRAGMAPYTGTVQVPGRQVFVESKRAGRDDGFELDSIVATGGKVRIKATKALTGAAGYVWNPLPDGKFESRPFAVPSSIKAGAVIEAPVAQPFSLVAIGGFAGDKFFEGFALAFRPADLKVELEAAASAAPLATVPVAISATNDGKPIRVSGILEAYDNRVNSKSPASPLGSAIGDSMRNAAGRLGSWVDQLELERRRAEAPAEMAEEKEMAAPSMAPPPPPAPVVSSAPKQKMMLAKPARGGKGGGGAPLAIAGEGGGAEDAGEPMRQGEKKVVFCERVQTDDTGRAKVNVTLPPQIGRVSFRFVAVKQFDHATVEKQIDVSKKAYAELKLPNNFVPGARLELPLTVSNTTNARVTLQLSGAGISGVDRRSFPPGSKQDVVRWKATDGTVTMVLSDSAGKVLDRRQMDAHDVSHQPVTFSRLEMGGGGKPIALQPGESAVVFQGPGQLLGGIVKNLVTTMYSWFGHAEAMSAQVAVRAVVLAAIDQRLISGEGLEQTLRVDLDKTVRHLREQFFDPGSGLVRPYPGLAPDPLWSTWTARNLHVMVDTLERAPRVKAQLGDAVTTAVQMASAIDRALAGRKMSDAERGGYAPGGLEMLPVEIDGKVVWRVLTDDAVQRFALEKVMPLVDPEAKSVELAFNKAFDRYRFLRAFERTGKLQYAMETARALWSAGPKARPEFNRLFAQITRGMIFTQEPGLIQGPALLGGVYSSPMAMVRFFELLMLMGGERAGAGSLSIQEGAKSRPLAFGEKVELRATATLTAPAGAVVRIDRAGAVDMSREGGRKDFAKVELSSRQLAVAQEAGLTLTLDAERSPMEYYALVAVPTTTAVKQTEDILSDYKGQLIYGQQGTGASKMQVLAVPFRGSRTIKLLLEGLLPGTSDGIVAVRHIDNAEDICTLRIKDVVVK